MKTATEDRLPEHRVSDPALGSRILRLGLINSGMFDLLELNLDVSAVHLVGANNVGKTSLIMLIQFLYFHDLTEMHFPKSRTESVAFYFRIEGSYILFEVRTVTGQIRTVGLYGAGSADSRKIFAFDGRFKIEDFLTEESYPLPLKKAQERLYSRRFEIYKRHADFERALIGEHTNAKHNVQLFNLSLRSFRLLRQLLQELLQLNALRAGNVRDFLVKLVQAADARVKINISRDFGRKNDEINRHKTRLEEYRLLQPFVQRWFELNERIAKLTVKLEEERRRRYFFSALLLKFLQAQEKKLTVAYEEQRKDQEIIDEEIRVLSGTEKQLEMEWQNTRRTFEEFQELTKSCRGKSAEQIQEQRDQQIARQQTLQQRIQESAGVTAERLQARLRAVERDGDDVLRALKSGTVNDLLKGFSEEERSLIRYLLSEKLINLSDKHVTDAKGLRAAARRPMESVNKSGVFTGFGLSIPRKTWFVPEDEHETLPERLARLQNERAELTDRLRAAQDLQLVEKERQKLVAEIKTYDEDLTRLKRLEQLRAEHENPAQLKGLLEKQRATHKETLAVIKQKTGELRDLRHASEKLYSNLDRLRARIATVAETHQAFAVVEGDCPDDISELQSSSEKLEQGLREVQAEVTRRTEEQRRLEAELSGPRHELEARYERENPEVPFEEWMEHNRNITAHIDKLELELFHLFRALISLVIRELEQLVRAFQEAQNRLAELNKLIRTASISNIEYIAVEINESDRLRNIRTICEIQLDLFSESSGLSFQRAQKYVEHDIMRQLQNIRLEDEIHLKDLFHLSFSVKFRSRSQPDKTEEIRNFESTGTEIGIKIILYLGLIRLLQKDRRGPASRIPFFLDEVGNIDGTNLRQIISYCEQNDFLPIFASPAMREEIQANYLFRRAGERSEFMDSIQVLPSESTEPEESEEES